MALACKRAHQEPERKVEQTDTVDMPGVDPLLLKFSFALDDVLC